MACVPGRFLLPLITVMIAGATLLFSPVSASAQGTAPTQSKPEMRESCPGLVASRPMDRGIVRKVALAGDEARLTYIGHATFLIESSRLVRIATDYNDYVRPPVLPDIITMNRAHSTHYTLSPDPAIKHVLRGWMEDGSPARHDVQVQDVRVRNVPTNIRDYAGGTARNGNSIFIFEIGSLCIAHLGHLHHTLTQQQLDDIGRLDAVMFPVDGSVTLDSDGMLEVLQALKAPVMIPMHAFSAITLNSFLDRARRLWTVEAAEVPSVVLSKSTLPATPKVLVLPGR